MNFKHYEHCKRCDRYVSPEAKPDCAICRGKDEESSHVVANIGCAIVLLAGLYGGYMLFDRISGWWGSSSTTKQYDMSMDYMTDGGWVFRGMAREAISSRLKAPATAEFPGDREISATKVGDHLYEFSGYVDAQNSFGALLRKYWVVTFLVKEPKDGKWRGTLMYVKLGDTVYLDRLPVSSPITRDTSIIDEQQPPQSGSRTKHGEASKAR